MSPAGVIRNLRSKRSGARGYPGYERPADVGCRNPRPQNLQNRRGGGARGTSCPEL